MERERERKGVGGSEIEIRDLGVGREGRRRRKGKKGRGLRKDELRMGLVEGGKKFREGWIRDFGEKEKGCGMVLISQMRGFVGKC